MPRPPDDDATLDTPPRTTPPPGPQAAPARIGRFEVRRFLGEGGFGRVYEAHDALLDRLVALKVAKRERFVGDASADRFVAEARAAANLRHPNIVAVFDSGRDGPNLFIASAYIAGRTLEELLQERRDGVPLREAIRATRRLAEALAYSHSKGVTHRDVKPGNVLLDEAGEPMLADFGLARRAVDSPDEHTAGTPAYMAPEQWAGQADAASDQYSLGCVLYLLLTGRRPFDAGSAGQYRYLHESTSLASPRAFRLEVSRDLEAVCLKCLEKEPARRYGSCQELADDLRRVEDGLPVRARQPGAVERASRWARRNPVATGLMASLGLLVVTLVVAGMTALRAGSETVKRLEAEKQADDEKREREKEQFQGALRLLLQRGAGKEALEQVEQAERDGLPLTPEIRLGRAQALSILSRREEAVAELRRLDRQNPPPDLKGLADLLEGNLLLGTKENERALQLIRGALSQELPRDQRLFGEGLLEATVPASLEKLKAAIEVNPGHIEARVMAILCHITLGQLEQAVLLGEQSQPLAPRHSHFPFLLAMASTLKGDKDRAKTHLTALAALGTDESRLRRIQGWLRPLGDFRKEFHGLMMARPTSSTALDWLLVLSTTDLNTPDTGLGLPATPALSAALRFMSDEYAGWVLRTPNANWIMKVSFRTAFPGVEKRSLFGATDPVGLARVREKLRDFPEGSLRFIFALQLQMRVYPSYQKDMASQEQRDRLAEAAQEFENAARSPGLFGHQAAALTYAAMLFSTAGAATHGNPGTPAWCEKARDLIRERQSVQPPMEGAGEFDVAARIVAYVKDYPFALTLLDRWKRAYPSSLNSTYYILMAKFYAEMGARERAREMLSKVTPAELKIAGTRNEVEGVRKQIEGAPQPGPKP